MGGMGGMPGMGGMGGMPGMGGMGGMPGMGGTMRSKYARLAERKAENSQEWAAWE